MEPKRTQMHPVQSMQSVQKGLTAKCQLIKTASDVSLTPSQIAEQAKNNSNKNPLDALSRMSLRPPTLEKRSGLQDVDEQYIKNNVFSKPVNSRLHSGLNDLNYNPGNRDIQNMLPAGLTQKQGTLAATESVYNLQVNSGDAPPPAQQGHQQQKLQANAQVSQGQPHAQTPQGQTYAQAPQGQVQAQAPQGQTQQGHSQQAQAQMQSNNQTYKDPHAGAVQAEPDMCTTCPNCQTTIYLVRENDAKAELSAGAGAP